jgi:WD40 repeat protein
MSGSSLPPAIGGLPPLLLELEFARAEQADDPFAFRFAPQDYLLRQEGGRTEVARFAWTPEVQAELAAIRLPGRDPTVLQRLGGRLRTFLKGTSWPQGEAQIVAAAAAGRGVVLTVRSAAAELYTLPWELLTLRDSGQHLGELPGLLLRYEWPGTQPAELAEAARVEGARILFAWSGAGGNVPAVEHSAAIRAALPAGSPLFVASRDIVPNVSYAKLSAQLEAARQGGEPIAVLHLLCHGSTSGQSFGLLLDGAAAGDGPAFINAGRLRQLLAPYASMLRLVVLCACDSANSGALGNQLGSIAQVLHRIGIPQVIASRYPLSVAGSLRFTTVFYSQLLDRLLSTEGAFLAARRELALDSEQIDWASLQLYQHAVSGEDNRPIALRPYRGLLAYGPEHQRFFFGRDSEIAEILADAGALLRGGKPRLLAIDGASGTGKSSVVFAGALSPLLQLLMAQYGVPAQLVRLRPGGSPLAALARALPPAADAAATSTPTPNLLIVDQFEELFTQTEDPGERREFARRLWALATSPDAKGLVVITLRSDFVGGCGELVVDDTGLRLDRVIYQESHRVSIARMSPQQLREVIEKPAQRVGLRLQAGLVERMLHDVDSEAGALPLIADTLDLLWLKRAGAELTQAAYDQIGGVTGALQGRADQLLAALPDAQQKQARRLLVRLGRGGSDLSQGVRQRVRIAAQRPQAAAEASSFDAMLAALVAARLVTVDRQGSEDTVEVAHEALLRRWPLLARWLKEDAQLLVELDLIDGWVRQFQTDGSLLRASQLERAVALLARHPEAQSGAVSELVSRSQDEHDRAQERDRFARDCLRMLAVRSLEGDAARQVAILREAESRTPTAVPMWLPYAVDLLQSALPLYAELQSPSAAAVLAAFSLDGKHLALGFRDGSLAQVSVQGGVLQPVAEGLVGLSALAYGPAGLGLISGTAEGLVRVHSLAIDSQPRVLRGHTGAISEIARSPGGSWFATASVDGTVRLWGPAEKSLSLTGHRGAVRAIAYSPDGNLLASAGEDGKVRVYNVANLGRSDRIDKPEILDEHEGPVHSLSFAKDSRHALTLGEDGTACLWDEEGDARVFGEREENVSAAVFTADGGRIILGCEDGTVRLHELSGKGSPALLVRGTGEVQSLAVSADGAWLAVSFDEDSPVVCNLQNRGQEYWLECHLGTVTALQFSPDSRYLLSLCEDGKARLFDLARRGMYIPRLSTPEQERSGFHIATTAAPPAAAPLSQTSPDGQRVGSAERDGSVRIRGGASTPPIVLPAAGGPLSALRFAPDGSHLVTVAADGKARLWNLVGGPPLLLPGHAGPIGGLDLSRDGKRVVLGATDGKLRVYTLDGSRAPEVLEGHSDAITLTAFAADGQRILSMSADGSTRLWREAGRSDVLIEGGAGEGDDEEYGVALSRDWQQLITERKGGPRLIWQLDLDPRTLIDRLWQATPFCLSATERERYLQESGEQAARNYQASLQRVREVGQGAKQNG